MLFNSLAFAVFFPLVTALYFALPHRWRWVLLLTASCVFYCFFIPIYISILAFTIVVDYLAGFLIEAHTGIARRLWLSASIVVNVGALGVFKYWNFAAGNINSFAAFIHWNHSIPLLGLVLPIGLSFHTFQAMSYTIEVYRGRQNAERHFGLYALYVMFYPQLVAGPIERPQNLLHQFRERHCFVYTRVTLGLKRMAWGLFKKVVIADRIAPTVDLVYSNPAVFSGPQVAAATILYAFQIYCDFSGYSDIAIGAAQVMGINLMTNFREPYYSTSISEFWKRWHISLSTWFRDYLYFPLGGNRVPGWHRVFNLLTVFLVSGLWHGANWTFIAWGFLHGFYLIVGLRTVGLRQSLAEASGLARFPRAHKFVRQAVTFGLVCFGWIFFRSASIGTAIAAVRQLFAGWAVSPRASLGVGLYEWVLIAAVVGILLSVDRLQGQGDIWERVSAMSGPRRWAVYYLLVGSIVLWGRFGAQQFIYFQF